MENTPVNFWGNSRRVRASEEVSRDGTLLTVMGTYEDNGESATYKIFSELGRCEASDRPIVPSRVVKRGKNFQRFSIVSSKTGAEISSDFIETSLMCRDPIRSPEIGTRMIQDFDVIRTGGDSSMGMVSFAGRRKGQPIEVVFATTTNPRILAYIYIGSDTAFSCD
jgi:hypothetical protein